MSSIKSMSIVMTGLRAAGITEALRDARDNSVDSLLDRRFVFMTVCFFNDHFYKFISLQLIS